MTEQMLVVGPCFTCKRTFGFDHMCGNSVRIDPETGMPPDVELVDGEAAPKRPEPEAVERSERTPICDDCVGRMNLVKGTSTLTQEERHRQSWGNLPLGVHD